jgi:hypothetical protein
MKKVKNLLSVILKAITVKNVIFSKILVLSFIGVNFLHLKQQLKLIGLIISLLLPLLATSWQSDGCYSWRADTISSWSAGGEASLQHAGGGGPLPLAAAPHPGGAVHPAATGGRQDSQVRF